MSENMDSKEIELDISKRAAKARNESNAITLSRELFNVVGKLRLLGLSDTEALQADAVRVIANRINTVACEGLLKVA